MKEIIAFCTPAVIYFGIFLLNLILPGRWVSGYVKKGNSTAPLRYRLNGLTVLFAVVGAWALLCYSGIVAWDSLYTYRWYTLSGAIVTGLIFSLAIVLPAPPVRNSFFADFYLGRLENPQLWGGRVDAKMWLYMVGAIMLELNILSFAAHHYQLYGAEASTGIFVATGLLSFFVTEYMFFEQVHLYTYDIFAERVGFKLGWGCIAFYPFFYAIPIWSTVDLAPASTPGFLLFIYVLIFFSGWCLARGANMQKYFFKKDPSQNFLGITPVTITDGSKMILVNGWWGLSRHINYLGEILMATGIVLCTGHVLLPWPWLYPLYYVALLFPRQRDDDKRCSLKYGPLWDQYIKKVPYRIIPFVY